MSKASITLADKQTDVEGGFVRSARLYKDLGVDVKEKWLYLNKDKDKDIDISLMPDDHIIIHGGEKIFADDVNADIGKNPNVRKPVCFRFNGKRLEAGFKQAKVTGHELRKLDEELDASKLFADLRGRADAFIKDDWVLVVQEKDCYITIPAGDADTIDLEECARANRTPPKGQKHYKIKVDGEQYQVNKAVLAGVAILALAGKTFADWTLNRKFHGGRRKAIAKDESVDFSDPGVERFETVRIQAQQG